MLYRVCFHYLTFVYVHENERFILNTDNYIISIDMHGLGRTHSEWK